MPRSLWLIIIGNVINVIGGSFLWPLNTIYLHEHLGKSLTVAGFVLMLNSAATIVGNLLGGYFFDKFGGYRSIMFGATITLFALVGITFWHGWPQYTIFLVLIGFGSGVVNPAIYALAGASWKEGGRKAFNAIYVGSNLGVAVGTALSGYIASFSFEYIFISNLALYLVFFAIVFFGYRKISEQAVISSSKTKVKTNTNSAASRRNLIALVIVSIGFTLSWISYIQWSTTISTYTQKLDISLEKYSLLWTVNGALIVLAQPLLAAFIKKFSLSLKQQILVGMIIFIAAFSVVSFSTAFTGFMAAMIIMTFGEMLVWPAIPTIADHLAPEGKGGFYQGIVNSFGTVGRMIGPLLGGLLVDLYGMNVLFSVLIILFIMAIGTTLTYDKILNKTEKTSDITQSL